MTTTAAISLPSWLVPLAYRALRLILAQILEELERREEEENLQRVATQVASSAPAPGNLQPGSGRGGRA